jgi:6-phosphogluconolactonase
MTLSRRTFLAAAAAAAATKRLNAAKPGRAATLPLVYIGSTTQKPDDGIHVASFDPSTGVLSEVRIAANVLSPGFLAIGKRSGAHCLYAGRHDGILSAYRIESNGDLVPINSIKVPAFDFVHTMLDQTARCIISVSYGTGKVLSAKLATDGRISDPVSQFQLTGHGPIKLRQEAPHAHGVAVSPDNRFVLINDLGTDRIMLYKLNASTAELKPSDPPFFKMPAGSGPRHLAFHPNGKWAYSVNELNSTLSLLHWNAVAGTLSLISDTSTLPAGGDITNNRAGEVVISQDGKFLYSCDRGGPGNGVEGGVDDVLAYSIGSDGKLTLVTRLPLEGKEARHFALSPDGEWLLVARQFSNDVTIYARNAKTGEIQPSSTHFPIDNASCVLFA